MAAISTTVFVSLANSFHRQHNMHMNTWLCTRYWIIGGVMYACTSDRPLPAKLPANENYISMRKRCQKVPVSSCIAALEPWTYTMVAGLNFHCYLWLLGALPPYPLALCPWTPLRDFHTPDPFWAHDRRVWRRCDELTVLFDLAFITFKSFAVVGDFKIERSVTINGLTKSKELKLLHDTAYNSTGGFKIAGPESLGKMPQPRLIS